MKKLTQMTIRIALEHKDQVKREFRIEWVLSRGKVQTSPHAETKKRITESNHDCKTETQEQQYPLDATDGRPKADLFLGPERDTSGGLFVSR